jgi:hypothetical protein
LNTIRDYNDPLDTPLGEHVVTELIPRLPIGWSAEGGNLRDIDRVFPLASIPDWLAGRLFYQLVTQLVRWLLLPLLVALVAHDVLAYAVGHRGGFVDGLVVNVAYEVLVLLVVFAVFVFAAPRVTRRTVRSARRLREAEHQYTHDAEEIQRRLEHGEAPALGEDAPGEIVVSVSGHRTRPR